MQVTSGPNAILARISSSSQAARIPKVLVRVWLAAETSPGLTQVRRYFENPLGLYAKVDFEYGSNDYELVYANSVAFSQLLTRIGETTWEA